MVKHLLLIVDDDKIIRKSIINKLKSKYDFIEAFDYDSAIQAYQENDISLCILDIEFDKEKNGIDVLKEIKKLNSSANVIMLSSIVDISRAIMCIKNGATDYIIKTGEGIKQELEIKIDQIMIRDIERRAYQSSMIMLQENNFFISNSDKIKTILKEINSVGDLRILIEGETGVGKTPIAIYANSILSKETKRPFVSINCAGISKERFQDQMFGHKKGAYTGAVEDSIGLVELARGGDLFLDEIVDLNMECQAELLTFLDNGEYRRLGETLTRKTDSRVISATNLDLKERVKEGKFRKDLYSRLSQCKILIPPLRERKDDIKPIMEHYIKQYSGYVKPYDERIFNLYCKFDWEEGNVRELRNAVMYMCQKAKEASSIELYHVNSDYYTDGCEQDLSTESYSSVIKDSLENIQIMGLENYISNIEKNIFTRMMIEQKSSRAMAAKLKMSPATLYRKMKKYNIKL